MTPATEDPSKRRVKVLVAGYQNDRNPVFRQTSKYDCDVEWTGADGGGWRKDADIVIIVQACIQKTKARDLRDHYAGGAIMLYPWNSFSEVATKFHAAMLAIKEQIKTQEKKNVTFRNTPTISLVKSDPPKRKQYSVEEVTKAVRDAVGAGWTNQEIADYLNLEWQTHQRMESAQFTEDIVVRISENHGIDNKSTAEAVKREDEQLDLINEVLKLNGMSDKDKLETIARINKGEIKSLEWTTKHAFNNTIEIVRHRIGAPGNVAARVKLSKDEARLILTNVDALMTFTKEATNGQG